MHGRKFAGSRELSSKLAGSMQLNLGHCIGETGQRFMLQGLEFLRYSAFRVLNVRVMGVLAGVIRV